MATPGVVQEVVSVAAEHAERVDTDCAFPAEAVDALRKTGLLGLVLPREIGGMGSGPVEFTEVVAQLSAACGSTAMIYLMHMAAAVTVAASPPPGLPDLLADMASGNNLAPWHSVNRVLVRTSGRPCPRRAPTVTASRCGPTRAG